MINYSSFINDIKKYFIEDSWFFRNKMIVPLSGEVKSISKKDFIKINDINDLIKKDEKYFFENVIDLLYEDVIFYYFFPFLLINCVEFNFKNNESLLLIMEKVAPNEFEIEVKYLELSLFTNNQRDVFCNFLNFCKAKNVEYTNECNAIQLALSCLNQRDKLIEEIYKNFDSNLDFLRGDRLVSCPSPNTIELQKRLKGVSWIDLVNNEELFFNFVVDDYYELSSKAFCYYLPVFLIMSLKKCFYDIDVVYTANYRLTCSKDFYVSFGVNYFLNKKQLNIIIDFLILFNKLISDKVFNKRSEKAIKEVWMQFLK